MLLVLVLAGCGPSVGDRFEVTIAELYYQKADAESGGPSDNWFRLSQAGRLDWVDHSEVEVLEPGKEWVKVRVTTGRRKDATGWIAAKALTQKP